MVVVVVVVRNEIGSSDLAPPLVENSNTGSLLTFLRTMPVEFAVPCPFGRIDGGSNRGISLALDGISSSNGSSLALSVEGRTCIAM